MKKPRFSESKIVSILNPVHPFDTDLIFFGGPGRGKVRRPYEFRPAWHR